MPAISDSEKSQAKEEETVAQEQYEAQKQAERDQMLAEMADEGGQDKQSSHSGGDDDDGNKLDDAQNLKDKFDQGKDLKDKLSGAKGAGEVGGAGAEGTGATAATGSGGAAAGSVTAGTGGATAATGMGAAGTASATATTGTVVTAGATETVATGGAGAPIAAAAIAAKLATTKKGKKVVIIGCLGCLGCFPSLLFMPLLLIMSVVGGLASVFNGEAANAGNSESTLVVVQKSVEPTAVAKDAVGATVTYKIIVTNNSDKDTVVRIKDEFTSSPNAGFATEITGYDKELDVSVLAGQTETKLYTVIIPHTDFDPGWVLFNKVNTSTDINGKEENSSAGATVVIGNPPTGPPAFSPLRNPDSTGGYVFGQTVVNSSGVTSTHEGLDIHDNSDTTVLSPFAQPAIVSLNSFNSGYGNYVILQSGDWSVYLTHLESQSSLAVGSVVGSNTVVGTMGCSGYCFGAHVHYEVHDNGVAVDPALYNAYTGHP